MKICEANGYAVYSNSEIANFESSTMALGNFDGVHIAHQKLLFEAVRLQKKLDASYVGAWCFAQNPAELLRGVTPERLSTLEEKISMLLSCGLDFVVVADFSKYISITAEEFADDLISEFGAVGLCCGFNFKFGHRGIGTPDHLLQKFGKDRIYVLPPVTLDGIVVSSSRIRAYIANGDMTSAARMLGRHFSLSSVVENGKRLGRTIGFPTANQFFTKTSIIPKFGIYATICTTEDGNRHFGVSNVGIRPTISDDADDHTVNCETYLLDFAGDLYDQNLTVEFCAFLRSEQRFDSIDALRAAIKKDTSDAREYFSSYT